MSQKEDKYIKIIITLLVMFTISFYIYLNHNQEENYDYVINIYQIYKNDVDSGITHLMNSEEFKAIDEDKQIDSMKCLLDQYQSSNEIKNVYYDPKTKMYTFQYKDGILGGVMLKDFDPNMN